MFSQEASRPQPAVSVHFDREAFQELGADSIGRLIYHKLRTQLAQVIQEAVLSAELDEDGQPRSVKDLRQLEPFRDYLNHRVDPNSGEDVPDDFEGGLSRMDYLMGLIERKLWEASGSRSRPTWLNASLANWRLILTELKSWQLNIAYDLEIYPHFESVDGLISEPSLLSTSVDRPEDMQRARLVGRLRPRVQVNSFTAYFMDANRQQYYLPLFDRYDQTWDFPQVQGRTDLSVTFDLNRENPVDVEFGPLRTSLREVFDEAGNLVEPGTRIPEEDVDYFINRVFEPQRYKDLLAALYRPIWFFEEDAETARFEELPLLRKIERQGLSDGQNILNDRKLNIGILLLNRNGKLETEIGILDSASFQEQRQSAEANGTLVALVESAIPLTAQPEFLLNDREQKLELSLQLPERMDLTWKIRQPHFPQFLFSEIENPLVQRILAGIPRQLPLSPDAHIRTILALPPQMVDGELEPLHAHIEVPYHFVTARQAEAMMERRRLQRAIESESARTGPERQDLEGVSVLERLQEDLAKVEAEIAQRVSQDLPITAPHVDQLKPDLSELGAAYVDEVQLHLHPAVRPIILDPQSSVPMYQQAYEYIPEIVGAAMRSVPPETVQHLVSEIQNELDSKISALSGESDEGPTTLRWNMESFDLVPGAVEVDWMGSSKADVPLIPIDPNLLSTAYPSLYELPAKHRLVTRVQLPREIAIELHDIQSPEARVDYVFLPLIAEEPPTLEVEWKIVKDAAGQLHTLPVAWNAPDALKAYQLDESQFEYRGLDPLTGVGAYSDPVVDVVSALPTAAPVIADITPTLLEASLKQTWLGQAIHYVAGDAIGWTAEQGVRAVGAVSSVYAPRIQSRYETFLERPEVLKTVRRQVEEQSPMILDSILENMVKAVNGELLPNLPPDAEEQERTENLLNLGRMIAPGEMAFYETAARFLFPPPGEPGPRDPDAPMSALQRTFEDGFQRIEDFAPLSQPVSEWKVDGQPALSRAEAEVTELLKRGFDGEFPEFWPDAFTIPEIVSLWRDDLVPTVREKFARLPIDYADAVESIINPSALLEDRVNQPANEIVTAALRGESPSPPSAQAPPAESVGESFQVDLPTLVCASDAENLSGDIEDGILLIHLFTEDQKDRLPGHQLPANPQAPIQSRAAATLYHQLPQGAPRDLSDQAQEEANRQLGYDPEFRRDPALASVNLDYVLNQVVRPNLEIIRRQAMEAARKESNLINDSFQIEIDENSLDLRVGPKPDGELGLVANFNVRIRQDGFLTNVDTKWLNVTWPLRVSASNLFMDRPEFPGQEPKVGYSISLQTDFPALIVGERESRNLQTWWFVLGEDGALAKALSGFRQSIPLEKTIGIPTIEDFTQVLISPPILVPEEGRRGHLFIMADVRETAAGQEVPRQSDNEFLIRPGEKLLPYLQRENRDQLHQILLSKLRASYGALATEDIEFLPWSGESSPFFLGARGDLRYHVMVRSKTSGELMTASVRLDHVLIHRDGAAMLEARLSDFDFGEQRSSLQQRLQILNSVASPSFNFLSIPASELSQVSNR